MDIVLILTKQRVITMPNNDESDVMRIANEIKRYLEDHPNSADTLEGITRWWLLRQRFEESALQVQEALEYLVLESEVERKINHGGDHLYFSAKQLSNDKK